MNDESMPAQSPHWWTRIRRPRLMFGLVVGLAAYAILTLATDASGRLRFIAAWDIGASATLIALFFGLRGSSADAIRRIAARQDAGKYAVLVLCLLAATASLVVIATEMPLVKAPDGLARTARVLLIIYTIAVSWAFIQSVFALHYAHDYYLSAELPQTEPRPASERLIFPGEASPTYGDFLYFSFTVGMTFQVSDVQVTDAEIRRVVMAHGIISFFYTTGILALAISLVGGLI